MMDDEDGTNLSRRRLLLIAAVFKSIYSPLIAELFKVH